jgi:hypothetical protein
MRARATRVQLVFTVVIAATVGIVPIWACQLAFPTVAENESASDAEAGTRKGGAVYNDFKESANWDSYDFANGVSTFSGGTFDGRYVYLAPWEGPAGRYDTHASFKGLDSWESFDIATLSEAGAAGSLYYCAGAAFDGHNVYFVPNNYGLPDDVIFAEFDTSMAFTDLAAWRTFDATAVLGTSVQGFAGEAFDGRFLYFVPALNGTVARYDTTAAFDVGASWSTFDMTKVKSGATGLTGAIFDGRYVYFLPEENDTSVADGGGILGDPDGIVMRYDTKAPFASESSWTSFDTSRLEGASTQGFSGGAFDGRYVYLSPLVSATGVIPRFDIQGDFTDKKAWSIFTANAVSGQANGFSGAGYDGRYVYMVPYGPYGNASFDGVAVRYDTTASFAAPGSWSSFNMETLFGLSAVGFQGAVFDGQYMYFLPDYNTTVVRFNARTPPEEPKLPAFSGSFF